MNALKIVAIVGLAFLLTSCDLSQVPALNGGRLSKEDSKAIGAACRHAGRALEDCFTLNPKTHQAGVFEGWRDMNDYMATNKIDTVAPEIPPKQPKTKMEDPAVGEKALPGSKSGVHVEHDAAVEHKPAAVVGGASGRWMPKQVNAGQTVQPFQEQVKAQALPQEQTQVQTQTPELQLPSDASKPSAPPKTNPRPWERRSQGGAAAVPDVGSGAVKADPKSHT